MSYSADKLAERAGVIDRMQAILNKAERESRDLNAAEVLEYTKLDAKQEILSETLGLPLQRPDSADRREVLAHFQAQLDQPINPATPLRAGNAAPESEAGVYLDAKTLRAGADAISNKLGVRACADVPKLGDFVRGIANMKSTPAVHNALSVGTDSSGGYTVPTVLMPGILEALVPASALLQAGAGIVSLGQGASAYHMAAVDTIPTPAWRSEAGNVAEAEPTFKRLTITPRSLSFAFKVSRELLMDSDNIDAALRVVIAQAFAKELDRAGLRGSGSAPEIRGLLNTSGIQTVTSGTNGAVLDDYSKFIAAAQEILTDNAPSPTAAIMHPRTLCSVAGFADSTGQPLRRPDMLDTLRMVTTSQIPTNLTVGTSSDCSEIYVGDFSQFRFFQREGISIQLATELYAGTGQIGFFCHTRVDVAAFYPAAFAVITGVRA